MNSILKLVVLIVLGLLPFGLISSLFGVASAEMAATIGLSADEVSLVNILFMACQVVGFISCVLLFRAKGLVSGIQLALGSGCASALLLANASTPALFYLGWALMGLSVSAILIGITQLVLELVGFRKMTLLTALMLILTTLAPMGFYPWLLAEAVDDMGWQLITMIAAVFMLSGQLWLTFNEQALNLPATSTQSPEAHSGWQSYAAFASAVLLLVYLLMRGEYYNWFDTPLYCVLWLIALALLMIGWVFKSPDDTTQSSQLLKDFKFLVFVYNGFLAGFAVMVSGSLLTQFLQALLGYNHINTGAVQITAFATMLVGMVLSVAASNQQRFPADALTPIGVVMILVSVWMLSRMPSDVAPDNLFIPMCLRGLGVGLLNVSVTIAVFAYIKPRQRLEGLSLFYLIRTFGGIIGGALFGWLMQFEKSQMAMNISNVLSQGKASLDTSASLVSHQLLTSGYLPQEPLVSAQLQGVIKAQTVNLALSNGLLWFIASIGILAPILLIGKKIAAKPTKTDI